MKNVGKKRDKKEKTRAVEDYQVKDVEKKKKRKRERKEKRMTVEDGKKRRMWEGKKGDKENDLRWMKEIKKRIIWGGRTDKRKLFEVEKK